MATLYITEFSDAQRASDIIQIAAEPAVNEQTVAISGSSASSTAFKNNTNLVRIATDAICSITFGTAPTATTSKRRMAADQVEYIGIPIGQAYKVAVITNT